MTNWHTNLDFQPLITFKGVHGGLYGYRCTTLTQGSGRVRLVTGATLTPGDQAHRGHITHELLHVLGHVHFQKRPDRDDFISVVWDNLPASEGTRYQFTKCDADAPCDPLGTAYDCMSIMHYRDTAFAVDPAQPTMLARDPTSCDLKSANRWLTWTDRDLLNKNYDCPTTPYDLGEGSFESHESTSPGDDYPVNYSREKWLTVAPGNTIQVTFASFQLEEDLEGCRYDYVQLRDGNGRTLLKACGTDLPPTSTTTTNRLHIAFNSDADYTAKGFTLQWKELGNNTAPILDPHGLDSTTVAPPVPQTKGVVTSPNYPGNYPSGQDITTNVTVAKGSKVGLLRAWCSNSQLYA